MERGILHVCHSLQIVEIAIYLLLISYLKPVIYAEYKMV